MIIVYPNYFNFPVVKEISDDENDLFLREADDNGEEFTDTGCPKFAIQSIGKR